jgi:hypothetical protein
MTKNITYKLCTMVLLVAGILTLSSVAHAKEATVPNGYADDTLEGGIATLMKSDYSQRRSSLSYSPILARIARERAYDMAMRGYFSHVNPDGIGPNFLVTQAGYPLPDFYGSERSGNNIESIAAGNATVDDTWRQWMGSSGHRTHILGLKDFYAEQTDYGIGHAYVPGSRYSHYWVVITARRGVRNSSSAANNSNSAGSSSRGESSFPYPHVVRKANGNLKPASGYVWVDKNDPNDFRVKLMPGLIKEDGKYRPAEGYDWVNPDNPRDLRVEPTQ